MTHGNEDSAAGLRIAPDIKRLNVFGHILPTCEAVARSRAGSSEPENFSTI